MKITIDTKDESNEDLITAMNIIKDILDKRNNTTNESAPSSGEMFGMFEKPKKEEKQPDIKVVPY